MFRARFLANLDDYRSINWPVKYPYWCSGFTDTHSVVVAYVENLEELLLNWPEASEIDITPVEAIKFSDRFPRPDWFKGGCV